MEQVPKDLVYDLVLSSFFMHVYGITPYKNLSSGLLELSNATRRWHDIIPQTP